MSCPKKEEKEINILNELFFFRSFLFFSSYFAANKPFGVSVLCLKISE